MKKVIASSIIATIVVAGVSGLVASANEWFDIQSKYENFENHFDWNDFQKGHKWVMKWLTTDEKESLSNMTDEEKQAFFEAKKAERKIEKEAKKLERESHNKVIDKLLAGEELTDEEETIRTEIIEKRAERQAEREARQVEMEEMKTIMEKKKTGEELTDEEETTLEDFRKSHKGKERWNRGEHERWWFDR